MDNRNIVIRDIAMVDLRGATDEQLSQIKSISRLALLVLNQSQDVSGIDISGVGSLLKRPDGENFKITNGSETVSASDVSEGKTYLMVNGVLTIEPDVTPEMILSRYSGMMINGIANCSRSVNDALSAIGATVNGRINAYPDGAILRLNQNVVLDDDFVEGNEPGLYAVNKLIALDADAAEKALAKGIGIFTKSVVCAYEARVHVAKLLKECSPRVTEIPEGFEYADSVRKIDRLRARRLRGRVFTQNDVELEFNVTADDLKHLKALYTAAGLTMSEKQFDELADIDFDCDKLKLRNPGDMCVYGEYALNAAALESLEGKRKLRVDGDLQLAGDVSAQLLTDKIESIEISGDVTASRDLWAVLAGLGTIGGDLIDADKQTDEPGDEEGKAHEVGVTYIEGMTMYKM